MEGLILSGKGCPDGLWFDVVVKVLFCVLGESGDELTINVSMISSRGLNESYCVCVILGNGQTVWVSPGLAYYRFCFILTTDAMLPHHDEFLLATAAFIYEVPVYKELLTVARSLLLYCCVTVGPSKVCASHFKDARLMYCLYGLHF